MDSLIFELVVPGGIGYVQSTAWESAGSKWRKTYYILQVDHDIIPPPNDVDRLAVRYVRSYTTHIVTVEADMIERYARLFSSVSLLLSPSLYSCYARIVSSLLTMASVTMIGMPPTFVGVSTGAPVGWKAIRLLRSCSSDGKAHTNSVESVWATLKRGFYGTYHWFSREHTQLYLDEVAFRLNINEGNCQRDTVDRMESLIRGVKGRRLTWKMLTKKN